MMDPPKAKLSLFEIAMIEQMNLDPGYEQYHEYVDMKVDFKFREHYEDHPKKYLPRLLAERAKLYCCKKMEIPVNDHQANWQRWIVVLPVFTLASFLFFAIVTALGVPTMFFSGEKQEANVLTVSVLICVMTLLSLIPTISLISLIFQKLKKRDSATIAVVTLWLIENRGGWALLRRQPRSSQRETSSPFATLLKKQSYFVSASTIFLSNLYFVLMGIAIWGVLWVFLFSEDVDYVLKGSLDSGEGGVHYRYSCTGA
jgi:hypothetical protein